MEPTKKKPVENKKDTWRQQMKLKKKQSKRNKLRARLVVHNIPFNATEGDLRDHFGKYGQVSQVTLLKREDGKLTGCGFVQFDLVQKAAKARHHLNGKPLLDRNITCDWAVPKRKYKKGPKDSDLPIPVEKIKVERGDAGDVKVEEVEDCCDMQNRGSDGEDKSEEELDDDVQCKSEDGEDKSDEELDDDEEDKHDTEEDAKQKPHVESNDAEEGKTIFIKNLPFLVTNKELGECMSQFGQLYYAIVCIDRLTEHSKGTGFVKFKNRESADKCLEDKNITLFGHTLDCHRALTKESLHKQNSERKDPKQKDSRNLYLVKEGIILAGSAAARGVSAADLAKRLQVEQYKTQMLRNLNMFVSRTRLVAHNLPPTWDDAKLRALFLKHSDKKAVIREARIMRNLRNMDSAGVGMSRGYGFVTYTTHEDAIKALRALNNNPNIFSESTRPIICFSIENRAKLNAKEKRVRNSQVKNPKSKLYNPQLAASNSAKGIESKSAKRPKPSDPEEVAGEEYSGVAATPGSKKMRSKFNLRTQAELHRDQLKKEKKRKKGAKKTLQQKQQEFTKQPRQKINKSKMESDNFSKLVSDYKQILFKGNTHNVKSKWYSE